MNDFQRHKKGDTAKWVFTGVAFLLVFDMLIGLCLQLFGTGKQKPSEWFKKETVAPDKSDKETASGGMTIADGYIKESGVKLMSASIATADYEENGISPQADSAYTLTANVAPAGADNKAVEWSIAWGTTNTEWSNGKSISDYLTLSSSTANPVTVTCKQPFGAQAIITCASQDNNELSATCTVDYKQKVLSLDPVFEANDGTRYKLSDSPTLLSLAFNNFNLNKEISIGSITDTFKFETFLSFSEESIEWMESNYPTWGSGYIKGADGFVEGRGFGLSYLFFPDHTCFIFTPSVAGSLWGTSNAEMAFYEDILPAFNRQTFPKLKLTVTVTDSKGGVTTHTYKLGLGSVPLRVYSVTLDKTSIVF